LAAVAAALAAAAAFGAFAEGGPTGPGGKYQPAGIVHRGEDVFSQDDVARWGGIQNVEMIRRRGPAGAADVLRSMRFSAPALPGYFAGGAVNAPQAAQGGLSAVPEEGEAPAAKIYVVSSMGQANDLSAELEGQVDIIVQNAIAQYRP
jgi:lambda family phage tail tape measure protein